LLSKWGDEKFAKKLEKHSLVFDPMRPLLKGGFFS
jgi:hypothetical protein